jgi:hypothetical protein
MAPCGPCLQARAYKHVLTNARVALTNTWRFQYTHDTRGLSSSAGPLASSRALCPTRLFICHPSAVHRLASCRSGYVRVHAKAAVLSRASDRARKEETHILIRTSKEGGCVDPRLWARSEAKREYSSKIIAQQWKERQAEDWKRTGSEPS